MLRELIAISSLIALMQEPVLHGTCVLTVSTMDSIVMAADGQTLMESPQEYAAKNPLLRYDRQIAPAEPKVAICGRIFLCAIAGVNPIHYKEAGINVDYDFQTWIATVGGDEHSSVREFSNAIQKKARETFHDMDAVLKRDDFWNSQSAMMKHLFAFRVAGFSTEGPVLCDTFLDIDRENRRLIYNDPQCGGSQDRQYSRLASRWHD